MIKYIFSDLDNTLLDSNKEISKDNLDTIKKANDKGIKFLFNTGRLPGFFMFYNDRLDLDSYVSGNGSLVVIDNKVIYSKCFDIEDRFKVFNYATERNIMARVFTKDKISVLDTFKDDPKGIFRLNKVTKEEMNEILNKEDVYKICFFDEDSSVLKEMESFTFNNCKNTIPTFSSPFFLELTSNIVSKGDGIARIRDYFGLNNNELLAIGDNYNDISMLDNDYISACPSNAIDEIKNICDYVSPLDNNHSAISDIIKHFCDL